ncbi:MAG: hypothetical protein K0R63_1156 [Rickettsiales bacterium]|jgi:hypothetical protein|nr:hypothetical protein [Rickettsiales bacterium]
MSKEQINQAAYTLLASNTVENSHAFAAAIKAAYDAQVDWIPTHTILVDEPRHKKIERTLLEFAVKNRCTRAVELLLADPAIATDMHPMINLLNISNHPDILKLLLSWREQDGKFIDLNKPSFLMSKPGYTPLYLSTMLQWRDPEGNGCTTPERLEKFAGRCAEAADGNSDASDNLLLLLAFAKAEEKNQPKLFEKLIKKACAKSADVTNKEIAIRKKSTFFAKVVEDHGLDIASVMIENIEHPRNSKEFSYQYKPNSDEFKSLLQAAKVELFAPALNSLARVAKKPMAKLTGESSLSTLAEDAIFVVVSHLTTPAADPHIAKETLREMSLEKILEREQHAERERKQTTRWISFGDMIKAEQSGKIAEIPPEDLAIMRANEKKDARDRVEERSNYSEKPDIDPDKKPTGRGRSNSI